MEMPRDYMARCAQHGRRGIFQYREDLIVGGLEYLRFIGIEFASAEYARRWDDRTMDHISWCALPSWESAETWLRGTADD